MREKKLGEEYLEGRSTQDEQREYGTHDDPSSGLSNEAKTKDNLEEIGETYGEISRFTLKGWEWIEVDREIIVLLESDFRREEDNTLLAQLKVLKVELERGLFDRRHKK